MNIPPVQVVIIISGIYTHNIILTFLDFFFGPNDPVNKVRWSNVELMLGQRRRRWPHTNPTLDQHLALAGEVPLRVGPTFDKNHSYSRLQYIHVFSSTMT